MEGRIHIAQLLSPFDCRTAVKNQKSACRPTEMSGPVSPSPTVIGTIVDSHAHSGLWLLWWFLLIPGSTCLRCVHIQYNTDVTQFARGTHLSQATGNYKQAFLLTQQIQETFLSQPFYGIIATLGKWWSFVAQQCTSFRLGLLGCTFPCTPLHCEVKRQGLRDSTTQTGLV